MYACHFYTGYFPRDQRQAGFHAQYRLLRVTGQGSSYRMDRGRPLPGAAPVGPDTPVNETIRIIEDNYEVREAFRHGPGTTDRTGLFQDNYLISYSGNLPGDFRFVFEQNYTVRTERVLDASRLAANPRLEQDLLLFRNRVTFKAEHPDFVVLLENSDGQGGWRYVWGAHTDAIGVDPPPRPALPTP